MTSSDDDAVFDATTLEGEWVRLEPIGPHHEAGLCRAIRDGELWTLFYTMVPHPDRVSAFIEDARRAHATGEGLSFATIDRRSGAVAGSTRFLHANLAYRRVEIGFTFLGASWQRTPINTEAKRLMLAHAFDTLGLNRVEFLTDFLNPTSRRAILRLGAKEEGVLRSHMVMGDGRVRDSVIYSITRPEWPGVAQHLDELLGRSRGAG